MAGRSSRWCNGVRDQVTVDLNATEEVLLRIAQLVEMICELSELDPNPILVLPPGQGCRIVDARIRIEPPRSPV
ncbi:MAG: acetate--CoA ligase family protein [Nitrospira sp.]|nr:acetate--CoA ligase family protein [Nitrospira sp.]